ncbi:biotin synthase [Apiospora saccharicola]|uniref:Biotin synthase n=1 Tax=Apiospora saccharicola TaxID=335842 RepID=A0ABR1W3S5_9PEZI
MAFRITSRRLAARVTATTTTTTTPVSNPASTATKATRAYATVGVETPTWTKSTLPIPPTAIRNTIAKPSQILRAAVAATKPRNDWTREQITAIYHEPLMELVHQAAKKVESVESVLEAARIARENGSTRFCMGAAWRDMRGRKNSLQNIAAMIRGARELKEAGLTAYNHNVDTSREFYPSVISTRTYDERLQTLGYVRDAGINVCLGGILGLGEETTDRVGLLYTVSTLPAHPESFPVNALVPIKGTPLGDREPLAFTEMLRMVATARVLMPETIIRIAAGRKTMSEEKQALCFMAGANAIFTGEKMLTTECNGYDENKAMFERWGLEPMKSFQKSPKPDA